MISKTFKVNLDNSKFLDVLRIASIKSMKSILQIKGKKISSQLSCIRIKFEGKSQLDELSKVLDQHFIKIKNLI